MKRLLTALLAGAAVFSIAFASAALLEVRGETIQAGVDTDVTCDADGVDANWGLETDDNTVRNVRISDINQTCFGAEMFVQVDGVDLGSTIIDANSETFSFSSPYPAPETINSLRIWIEG
jgi:hypothetical protein